MSARIRRSPAAKRDLVEHALYIAQDDPRAAERFLQAAEGAFRDLAALPGIGHLQHLGNPRLAGMRAWRVPGFPRHLVFYIPREGSIDIIRVLHGARDLPAAFSGHDAGSGT